MGIIRIAARQYFQRAGNKAEPAGAQRRESRPRGVPKLAVNTVVLGLIAGAFFVSRVFAQGISLTIAPQTNSYVLSWNSSPGSIYRLQNTFNLVSGPWTTFVALYGGSNSAQWTDFAPTDKARFYRVQSPSLQLTRTEPAVVAGAPGTNIYIQGYGLDTASQVMIGGIAVSGLTNLGGGVLEGGLPSLSAGYYDVQLYDGGGHLVAVLTNGVQVVADSTSPALKVEPPGTSPGDPSGTGCSARAQNDPGGMFLFSGEVHSTAVDLMIRGVGMNFIWSRSYRSIIGTNTSQGNGWTYGYNISIQPSGPDVALVDGNARRDTYFHQPDGTYSRYGYMREGYFDTNGAFILTFPDTGTWSFKPVNGSPEQGKIALITDRNGNVMQFSYDFAGRLAAVVDTLNRTNTFNYDGNGFLTSVTDFGGRTITYSYYQNSEAGGSFGDLKSVTGPPVTGTPNGNDFPLGKTTTYTYTTGNGDDRLNHKLLTITDPKGQTALQYTYATATDPTALDYGRVTARTSGYSNETAYFSYSRITPAPTNNYATQKTIVNDAVGNVAEFFYDSQNRQVIQRSYTGRAMTGQAVTDSDNRPAGKLRASDPDYYESRQEYNIDSLPTKYTSPAGIVTEKYYEPDFNPAAERRIRANVRMERRLAGPAGGDQSALVTQYEYDTSMGGCCGFNFVTKLTDPLGNVTRYAYDSHGNRTNMTGAITSVTESYQYNSRGQMIARTLPNNGNNYRRRDVMAYYTNGPQTGYLYQKITDSQTLALTNTYFRDAFGNLTGMIDPRGNDSTNYFNQLDQPVRRISRPVNTASNGPVRYAQEIFYDANNNRVQVNTLNVDEDGNPRTPNWLTNTMTYDILDQPASVTRQVDATNSITVQYQYDANHQRVLNVSGEAVNGHQPDNVVQTVYDERRLPYQVIRAPGDAQQSTIQYDYDADRDLVRVNEGVEDTATPHLTTVVYDGFDRMAATTDAMGNVTSRHYDAAGNVTSTRIDGELTDYTGSASNRMLSLTSFTYDALNRPVQTDCAFFDPASGTNFAGGHSISRLIYNDRSQVVQTIDPNGNSVKTVYDTTGRRSVVTDAMTNTFTYTYDANSKVILVTEADLSSIGSPTKTFRTTNDYDSLNRLIQVHDNLGNSMRYTYDSLGDRVAFIDGRGNLTRYQFDGLRRLTNTVRYLTADGTGASAIIGSINIARRYDDNSRVVAEEDGNTNATAYAYDSLNRVVRTVFADGSTNGATYDVHNNMVLSVDAGGNVITATYDPANRLTGKAIARAAGVSGTTFENYSYDGLSRVVFAQNDDALAIYDYDSLSGIEHETQQIISSSAPARTVAYTYDAAGNRIACKYPSGRIVNMSHDGLERVRTISDVSGLIATYNYFGGKRVERRDYGNGTRANYAYDGLLRMTNAVHRLIASGTPFDSLSYAWDAAYNQVGINDALAPAADARSFEYDSMNRLVESVTAGGPTIDYDLDAAGNRLSVSGGTNSGAYSLNAGPDSVMNQYTSTPFDSRTYDANGNLGGAGTRIFVYDYQNRLLSVSNFNGSTYTNVMSAKYDCFGRRMEKTSAAGIFRYYYERSDEIEEQNGSNAPVATSVWGRTDELLSTDRGGQRRFFHEDDLGSIRKVTDAAHNVVEQYLYGDYGDPRFYNGSGARLFGTQIGNDTLFTGRRYDEETGLSYYRARYLDHAAGRFITRDPVGIWGDSHAYGNGYTYVGNGPESAVDPSGLMMENPPTVPQFCYDAYNKCGSVFTNVYSPYWLKDQVFIAWCPWTTGPQPMTNGGVGCKVILNPNYSPDLVNTVNTTCSKLFTACQVNDQVFDPPWQIWLENWSDAGPDDNGYSPDVGCTDMGAYPDPFDDKAIDDWLKKWGSAKTEDPCAEVAIQTQGRNPNAAGGSFIFTGQPQVPVLPIANAAIVWRGNPHVPILPFGPAASTARKPKPSPPPPNPGPIIFTGTPHVPVLP